MTMECYVERMHQEICFWNCFVASLNGGADGEDTSLLLLYEWGGW